MRLLLLICGCLGLFAFPRLITHPPHSVGVQPAMDYFRSESQGFAASCKALKKAASSKDFQRTAVQQTLLECRYHYKHIESFLEYFFRSSSTIYNRAPKFEAEEGSMEYQSPIGLQLIEAMLYDPHIDKKALIEQINAVESSASDLPALLYDLHAGDPQILESLRFELIRIMALDITGYEAPFLKSGIRESYAALEAFSHQLQPYLQNNSDSIRFYLERTMNLLSKNELFDNFDRVTFLRNAALPLQRHLNQLIHDRGLDLNTSKTLNYSAKDIFAPDALLPEKFPGENTGNTTSANNTQTLTALGQQLFNDKRLSGNGLKSCASCHDPQKAFTDRLTVSIGLDGHQHVDRNAPSLLYSVYQFNQFWDGRAKSLEQQIRTVLKDPREMHADTINEQNVQAIAAYVRSLHPMNSPFDRYIRGENNMLSENSTLSEKAKKGANLFMGKAQCATCHFIPLFNGLIPPDYAQSEFEVLGTTASDDFKHPVHLSKDSGRYKQYPLDFFKGAFKTPTVRDAALTYPYMHNGAFKSLETVVEFYDKGGGAGLGLSVPDQTLSSTPLHLSVEEKKDIILFINTLTDNLSPTP